MTTEVHCSTASIKFLELGDEIPDLDDAGEEEEEEADDGGASDEKDDDGSVSDAAASSSCCCGDSTAMAAVETGLPSGRQ